jgi:Fur family ferric uptake transcriptional regulator
MSEGAHILPNLPRVSASRREEALPYEPVCAIFRRYLHGRKLKFTPERAMILDAVLRRTGLFEAERLVADLKQIGHSVSRATAYRTLAHLQDAGIIKQVFFDNKQSYYEVIAGRQTYDYLICVATGKVVEFSSDKLRKLRDEICREHGFSPLSHQFHIFAISPEGQFAPPTGPDVPLAQGHERGQSENGQAHLAAPEGRGGEGRGEVHGEVRGDIPGDVRHGGNHS